MLGSIDISGPVAAFASFGLFALGAGGAVGRVLHNRRARRAEEREVAEQAAATREANLLQMETFFLGTPASKWEPHHPGFVERFDSLEKTVRDTVVPALDTIGGQLRELVRSGTGPGGDGSHGGGYEAP